MASKNRTANPLLLAFIIPLTLACLWTLIPTYVKYKVNNEAEAYAEKQWENTVAQNQFSDNQIEEFRDSFTRSVKDTLREDNELTIEKMQENSSSQVSEEEAVKQFFESKNDLILKEVDSMIAEKTKFSNPSTEDKNQAVKRSVSAYKDSIRRSDDNIFLVWDYKKVEQQSINFGLDLQGGLAITLIIDKADALTKLATPTKEAEIRAIVQKTDEEVKKTNAEDYLTVFQKVFEEEKNDPLGSYFNTERLSSISNSSSNNAVISLLRDEIS